MQQIAKRLLAPAALLVACSLPIGCGEKPDARSATTTDPSGTIPMYEESNTPRTEPSTAPPQPGAYDDSGFGDAGPGSTTAQQSTTTAPAGQQTSTAPGTQQTSTAPR